MLRVSVFCLLKANATHSYSASNKAHHCVFAVPNGTAAYSLMRQRRKRIMIDLARSMAKWSHQDRVRHCLLRGQSS